MSPRRAAARWGRALALVPTLLACSSGSRTTGGATPAPSASGAPSDVAGDDDVPSSRCVGTAVESYRMHDPASCRLQGGSWRHSYEECSGTNRPVTCRRGDNGLPDPAQKAVCLDIVGCGWREPDGTVTEPSGRCEGKKVRCSEISGDCRKQPGCTADGMRCVEKNGLYYLDNADCSELQLSGHVAYSVVKGACERAIGCTWVE